MSEQQKMLTDAEAWIACFYFEQYVVAGYEPQMLPAGFVRASALQLLEGVAAMTPVQFAALREAPSRWQNYLATWPGLSMEQRGQVRAAWSERCGLAASSVGTATALPPPAPVQDRAQRILQEIREAEARGDHARARAIGEKFAVESRAQHVGHMNLMATIANPLNPTRYI
ncbi:MAG: hypothetical protein V4510_10595 [bacterium]